GPILLTLTVHLEGWQLDRPDPLGVPTYDNYVAMIEGYVDLLDEYDATFTWEASYLQFHQPGRTEVKPQGVFDPAHPNYIATTLFSLLSSRGQDTGVHADLGGNPSKPYSDAFFQADLEVMKANMTALGGRVTHVSGICSDLDWAQAAIRAGFQFTTGNVAYCVSAMPREARPDPYKDCRGASDCHQTYPDAIEKRIHPWRIKDGASWLDDDPSGELVVLPTSGGLNCLHESSTSSASATVCELNADDLNVLRPDLERAIALRDPDKVNMYYLVLSIGSPYDKEDVRPFLKLVQEYVDKGQVEWSTANKIYSAYTQWERTHR
ncbi:MAG: hypothetical protein ACE5G0_17180, partial [Rhodothermales bacterium]